MPVPQTASKGSISVKLLAILFLITFFKTQAIGQQQAGTQILSFDKGWRFHLGDISFPVIKGHGMSYSAAKAGRAWGAAAPDYDDTDWRQLDLPHDWAVEMPYDSTANLSQGYRQRGIGWYRRNFKLDKADHGKSLELQFDGIATFSTIWVNGTIVHRNWCGYTSSYIDITPYVKYGDALNNIVVRVDANAQEGWWYEGAGIYRHTWLVKRSPLHIITDGVYAHPIKQNKGWLIPVEATVQNSGAKRLAFDVEVSLFDANGKQVAQAKTSATADALMQTKANLSMPISNPQLWTLEKPTLYKVRTVINSNGNAVDTLMTTCGFRTTQFRADSGFYLNGKHVKLQGVCNHQDHAGVGVAVPASLWDFRLKKLKEMGVNAYRCAHNPPAKEFLDACDRMGILVMDENRNFNTSPEYMRQLEWMVRRDRNHPSVIIWSVFNEEPMAGTENGYEMVRRMNALVKTLDTTRAVTAAANGGLFEPVNVSQAVDLVGFNYQPDNYDRFHKEHPEMKITSSEDVSGLMTRGEYANDPKKHVMEAYDTQTSDWGLTQRQSWKAIDQRPFVAGCFIWTGFDYRGEPQPFTWPTASSSFGIMDVCGFPKTAFYLHQAQWLQQPVLELVPHWNWPQDSIGKTIRVMALSNADKVKLMLNGKEIGEQVVDKYEMNTFKVPYQPGKLEAFGYKGGRQVSYFVVETTGKPVAIQLIPDRDAINGEGRDAVPVTVRVVDSKGRPVQTAQSPINFSISGPGAIIGVGNGDANSHEPEKATSRSLYNGLAQVILQSKRDGNGKLVLTAKSPGLKDAVLTINVLPAGAVPQVAAISPLLLLDNWRISPVTATRPDPNQYLADDDQNTWAPVKAGSLQQLAGGRYMVYRTRFTPFKSQQAKGGKLILKGITGKAEVYIDTKLAATKKTSTAGDLEVPLTAGTGERIISVLIEADNGSKAGLGGLVSGQDL